MAYARFDTTDDLNKLSQGQRTKMDAETLLLLVLDRRPELQEQHARAFGISLGNQEGRNARVER